ncbi:MAG: DUF484 family protein, partial [Paraglaciecola sp.]|nr:DUF484 family protein [Paraglaciecola sp.]
MSDVMGQQKSELEIGQGFDNNALSDTEIADYLLSHPDFFIKHAHLLEDLTIPHTLKGSVSLVELQSEQLRKKVRLLNYKLNQLISIARQNEQIYRVYADLNLRL